MEIKSLHTYVNPQRETNYQHNGTIYGQLMIVIVGKNDFISMKRILNWSRKKK